MIQQFRPLVVLLEDLGSRNSVPSAMQFHFQKDLIFLFWLLQVTHVHFMQT